MYPGCERFTFNEKTGVSGARGLCQNCYSNTLNKVKRGKYTWEGLEAKGLVLPKMTQEEKNLNQNHSHRTYRKKVVAV